jgi:metal-responsive CopG/Arc/MetJ family transcriptional regulator
VEDPNRLTIRLTRELIEELDEIVREGNEGGARYSRASLARHWIERGIAEKRRKR